MFSSLSVCVLYYSNFHRMQMTRHNLDNENVIVALKYCHQKHFSLQLDVFLDIPLP
jgi:hypothetical protein